jgi:hypothetical protein
MIFSSRRKMNEKIAKASKSAQGKENIPEN